MGQTLIYNFLYEVFQNANKFGIRKIIISTNTRFVKNKSFIFVKMLLLKLSARRHEHMAMTNLII